METIRIRKGFNFTQAGAPYQLGDSPCDSTDASQRVALSGEDYRHLQPEFRVSVGDRVLIGQPLFVDRNQPDVIFTSPANGVVQQIEFGRRRTLGLLEIERQGENQIDINLPDTDTDRQQLQQLLLETGLWTALKTRPFNRIPVPYSIPDDIVVTAIDTEPLAADPRNVLKPDLNYFRRGINSLSCLTDGVVYVCQSPGSPLYDADTERIKNIAFTGAHPAGLAGTHIAKLSPVNRYKTVWSMGYQDVVALGELLEHGSIRTTRTIALAGSGVPQPRLMKVQLGAYLDDILKHDRITLDCDVLSGSALSGSIRQWLGRFHNQVTVLRREPVEQKLFNRIQHQLERFFIGSEAIVPDCWLDGASPLTDLTIPLLRALAIGDLDMAEAAGCLGFAAEDIAVLSHACSSGHDYSVLLNRCLDEIHGSIALDEAA